MDAGDPGRAPNFTFSTRLTRSITDLGQVIYELRGSQTCRNNQYAPEIIGLARTGR